MSPKNPEPGGGDKPRPAPRAAATTGELSTGVRTTISLLLFIHFFFILAAVAASFAPVSPLRAEFGRRFFRAYPETLYQDLAYNFHLTYAELDDTDHALVLDLPATEGQAEAVQVVLPEPGLQPGIRRRRYQMLAYYLTQSSENDEIGALLPRAVGSRVMNERGVEQVTLRARAHLLQDIEDVTSDDPSRNDPRAERYLRDQYQARVWRDAGEVQLYRIEERGDTAPVADGQSGS